MIDLSVIIVNYRTEGLLKQCLRGLAQSMPEAATVETIVVDNDSRDGSAAMVRRFFPDVRLVATDRNGGFAYGVNRGMGIATGRYRLVMNSDLAVFPGVLESLIRYLDANPSVGLVGPRLQNPDGTVQLSCRMFPTPATPLLSRTPLGRLPPFREQLRTYLMADWDHAKPRDVPWVLGAAVVVRAEAALAVGPLDERFFLYFEDVDWCRRFWEKGWVVRYLPSVELVHYHQRLSAEAGLIGALTDPATRIHIASAWRYFRKYRGRQFPRVGSPHAQ